MALDTLTLGPFEFTDFAVPHSMPFQGKHHFVVHKMPGGDRTVDAMGPDDPDPSWEGIFWGADAESKAQILRTMCHAGKELPFSWGFESRSVVISEFDSHVEKFNCVHYRITLIFTDNPLGSGSGSSAGSISLDSMVGSDLSAAQDVAASSLGSPEAQALAGGTAPL